ncbi:MAG: uroporphyrinogen-III synthase [Balneolaceae bacterium]|nr:uroporphyrinogen-III synthase [Balneolaceae bacterium]
MAATEPTILLTSALEDAEVLLNWVEKKNIRLLHLPLEKYVSSEPDEEDLVELLESSENIIYGHKRNAKFFMKYAKEQNLLKQVIDRVNLAAQERTAIYLEEQGVPAIYPGSEEPIKMLEFLMRLRRLGTVFYPCGSHKNDEIPGLLSELDIDVQERIFYELQGPSAEELETYKAQLQKQR